MAHQSTAATLTRLTGPATLPLSISEAKTTLRLPQADSTFDNELSAAISAATEFFEQDTDRVLISQTFIRQLFQFPTSAGEAIPLWHQPIRSVTEIRYWDDENAQQTLTATDYYLDLGRREIRLAYGVDTWPSTASGGRGVEIEYVAGYGDTPASVPDICRRAIALLASKWFYDPAMEDTTARDMQAYKMIIRGLTPTHQN